MLRYAAALFLAPLAFAQPCPPYAGPGTLNYCQYGGADMWLMEYLSNLYQKEGVTSSTELKNPWPSYIWADYEGSRSWSCQISACTEPTAPDANASPDQLNAYFILQSVYTFTTYLQGLNGVLQASLKYFIDAPLLPSDGLEGVTSQFEIYPVYRSPLDPVDRMCNYTSLFQMGLAVLGQLPISPNAAPGMSGWEWMTEWVTMPGVPLDTCNNAETQFRNMISSYMTALDAAWKSFSTNVAFAEEIMPDGWFLAPPTSVTEAWNDPDVKHFLEIQL
jgi:hypothetical protein